MITKLKKQNFKMSVVRVLKILTKQKILKETQNWEKRLIIFLKKRHKNIKQGK